MGVRFDMSKLKTKNDKIENIEPIIEEPFIKGDFEEFEEPSETVGEEEFIEPSVKEEFEESLTKKEFEEPSVKEAPTKTVEEDHIKEPSVSWKVSPSNTTDSSLKTTIQEIVGEEKTPVKIQLKTKPKEIPLTAVDRMRIPTSNDPDKVIAIHIATTGIDIHEDHEILKVAIINKDGDYLFNSFIKPEIHTEWNEAEKFNGITPEMVKDAPIISDVAMDLQNIFDNAEIIVGHNLKFSKDYLEKFIEYSFDNKKLVDIMDIHRADYPGYKHKLADVVQSFCPDKYDDFMKEANTLERTVTYLMESYNSLLREREEKAKKEKQTEETKEEIKKQDDLDREDHEIEEENEKQSHKDINKEQQLIYLQKQVEAMRATIIALTATVDNLQKMVTSKVEELTATTELTQQQIQNVAINCNDVSLQLRDIILQNNIEVPDISAR